MSMFERVMSLFVNILDPHNEILFIFFLPNKLLTVANFFLILYQYIFTCYTNEIIKIYGKMTMSQIIRNLTISSEKDIQRKKTHMRQNKYMIKDLSKENIKLKHA